MSGEKLLHNSLPPDGKQELVVVAMSGGVDSSAAALLLQQQGYEVIGVSMQVWDYRASASEGAGKSCCAPGDFQDARRVAALGEFPFYIFDFESSFRQEVVEPFIEAYLSGLTPNPCLDCNRKVKFRDLRRRASSLGAKKVATGHYAQIKALAEGKRGLFSARDQEKDQSYFLYALSQEELSRTLFPVGGMKKSEVREYLASRGLDFGAKEESQDICFIATDVGDFIEAQRGAQAAGEIISNEGRVLGRHQGIHRFTVGQRRGLGVSSEEPLYVLAIDSERNQVIVGKKEELRRESFRVSALSWVAGVAPGEQFEAEVKVRYRHAGIRCMVAIKEDAAGSPYAQVKFQNEWSSIAPGQAAVFYRSERDAAGDLQVLGGGIIEAEAQGKQSC